MKTRLLLAILLLLASTVSFAGFGSLKASASDLQYAAEDYAERVHYYNGSSKLNRAASRFAKSAAYFFNLVSYGGDEYALEKAYNDLQKRYYDLQKRANNRYRKAPRLDKVVYAFNQAQKATQYYLNSYSNNYRKPRQYGHNQRSRYHDRDRLSLRFALRY